MLRFLLRRVVLVVPTFIGVTLLSFLLIHLVPGDPIEVRFGERGVSPQRLAELRHEAGLDRPLWQQFLAYEGQVATGHLGTSVVTHEPVWTEFVTLFPATIELSVCAILFAIALGLPFGVIAAVRRGSVFDYGLMGLSVTGASMPIFWWGLMMILVFSVALGWTPVSGRISDAYYVEPWTGFMLIDAWFSDDRGAVALRAVASGPADDRARHDPARDRRAHDALGDAGSAGRGLYPHRAREGAEHLRVVVVHALRNALIPVVTVIGLQVGTLLGGAILTETIFSWPGVGHWLIESIQRRDYPVLQGGTLLVASLVMLVNLGVDLAYGFLNPRIRR